MSSESGPSKLGILAAGVGWGLSATWPATGVEYAVLGAVMGLAGLAIMASSDTTVQEVSPDAR